MNLQDMRAVSLGCCEFLMQWHVSGSPTSFASLSSASSSSSASLCAVCLDAAITHVFVPCGHSCVCHSCADAIMGSKTACPICPTTPHVQTAMGASAYLRARVLRPHWMM